jgi:hypothetical protein
MKEIKHVAYLGGEWDEGRRIVVEFIHYLKDIGIEVDDRRKATPSMKGTSAYDLAICWGIREYQRYMIQQFREEGVRTLVFDLGYFKRAWSGFKKTGSYYQVGVDGLQWLPPHKMPGDRWKALGLEVLPPNPGTDKVLIIGQVPRDAQHGMDQWELEDWYIQKFREYAGVRGGIRFRPHPQASWHIPRIRGLSVSVWNTLDEDMDWADIVVTYNSTVGFEARRRGLTVDCDPSAPYYAYNFSGPIRDLLNRTAYAQWTEKEIRDGTMWGFMQKHCEPWDFSKEEMEWKAVMP